MPFGAVAGALAAHRGIAGSRTPNKRRRKRPQRKLTTSEAAIRRAEARKRGGRGRTPTPRKPWGTQGGPRADAKPTGRGPKTSGTTRTAIARSKSRRPKRTTSQAAIARFKAMRGRRR